MGEATDGERLAEFAGRLCYMSQKNPASRTTRDYLENIKKQGHGSVLVVEIAAGRLTRIRPDGSTEVVGGGHACVPFRLCLSSVVSSTSRGTVPGVVPVP